MRALITGGGGQLGVECLIRAPPDWSVSALSRAELDIADAGAVDCAVARLRPDLIINAAAYTAVDRAETEADAAFRVNRDGPGILAAAAATSGARLVTVSTDFVFDGKSGHAYAPGDPPAPLGVYGSSKLAGETAARAALPDVLIVRTAWVYASHGSNFLNTMLRLMASKGKVSVVADQIGTPTSAASLADALWSLAARRASGLHHFTNAGVASWYDFAVAIAEDGLSFGLLNEAPRVSPIITADYPTAAHRPACGVLDKTETWAVLGAPAVHWRVALREVLVEIARSGAAAALRDPVSSVNIA